MWAVVPLKSPESAKSRLSSALDPAERLTLFYSMAQHVLHTLTATAGVSCVAVVTASPAIEHFARRMNATVIRQKRDAGTASAFAAAVAQLRSKSFVSLLMISGDLPLLTTEAVRRMIAGTGGSSGILIAPDRRGVGTNALCCSPPHAIPPSFGVGSLSRHLALARQNQVPAELVHMPELAVDLDVPADLDYLRHRLSTVPRFCKPLLAAGRRNVCPPVGG